MKYPKCPIADCVCCDRPLYEAPTRDGWSRIGHRKGLCWDCIESMHRTMARCQDADGPIDLADAWAQGHAAGMAEGLVLGAEAAESLWPTRVCDTCEWRSLDVSDEDGDAWWCARHGHDLDDDNRGCVHWEVRE